MYVWYAIRSYRCDYKDRRLGREIEVKQEVLKVLRVFRCFLKELTDIEGLFLIRKEKEFQRTGA